MKRLSIAIMAALLATVSFAADNPNEVVVAQDSISRTVVLLDTIDKPEPGFFSVIYEFRSYARPGVDTRKIFLSMDTCRKGFGEYRPYDKLRKEPVSLSGTSEFSAMARIICSEMKKRGETNPGILD